MPRPHRLARFSLSLAAALAGCTPIVTTAPVAPGHAAPASPEALRCPDVEPDGSRPPLTLPAVDPRLDEAQAVPEALAAPARRIVARFEAGGGDAYANVSSLDGISIGFSQWNHSTGSLYSTFLKAVTIEEIGLAPDGVRSDLVALKNDPSARDGIIASWRTAGGGIRSTVREDLQGWLGLPEIRARQDQVIEPDLREAYAAARAWRRDTGSAAPVTAQLVAYFFDLYTYNGGTQGLWVQHVRAFRATHSDPASVLAEIEAWLVVCEAAVVPGQRDTRLYNREDALRNARYWQQLLRQSPALFNADTLDLLALGYLRARQANGPNRPNGFPGVFQADVMLRRGFIAIGSGYFPGDRTPTTVFTPG